MYYFESKNKNNKTFRKRNVKIHSLRRGDRELKHKSVERIYRHGLTKGEKLGEWVATHWTLQ